MLDTVEKRFTFLSPHIKVYGPDDQKPRPTVIIFHACNGVRPVTHEYAKIAAALEARVFVVDSFTPRGWGYAESIAMVCTGLALQGYERSGDVLAAIWGISQRVDVDADNILLAGWSHGAWSIMDLMTQTLDQEGDARLKNPSPECLTGVKGVFLVYPYISFPARTLNHSWKYRPKVLGVLAKNDALTPIKQAEEAFENLKSQGVAAETIILDASHSFDEENLHFSPLLAYSPIAHMQAQATFEMFIKSFL